MRSWIRIGIGWLALALSGPAAASAQTLTLTGPATARVGSSISVNLALSAPPPANLAGIQWAVTLPPGGYTATAAAGAASIGAAKILYVNSSATLGLTVGVNANVYGPGVVAVYTIRIPPGGPPGPTAIPLSGVLGAALDGGAVALTAGPAYSVRVLARSDINGDGAVDIQDLLLLIQEILEGGPGPGPGPGPVANDQNGDGVIDVRDAQTVARAIPPPGP